MLLQNRIVRGPLSVIPCFHIHSILSYGMVFSGGSAVAKVDCSRSTMGSTMLLQYTELWNCLLGWQCWLQQRILRGQVWVLPCFQSILSYGILPSGMAVLVATADCSKSTMGFFHASTVYWAMEWSFWQCCCKSGLFEDFVVFTIWFSVGPYLRCWWFWHLFFFVWISVFTLLSHNLQ